MERKLWKHLLSVREKSPLVHNITNYVVMNNTANTLLAVGASPIMAHALPEIRDMVSLSRALVINIGTLDDDWSRSMLAAAQAANELQRPWILDPVGAGATGYRDRLLAQLLELRPTVIRGNASEIMALAKQHIGRTKGVDSTAMSQEAHESAKSLVQQYGGVVSVSGKRDIIISEEGEHYLDNGHGLMAKVTGLGCSLTALMGAFIGTVDNKTEAVLAAAAIFGVAGELAASVSKGPGSLQVNLLDKLHNITEDEFLQTVKLNH
tara:strand:+ start:92225 stop:93019 length:795 start_codon:yes stop_codon:yes gene_type:complete